MPKKPTYQELEQRIKELEKESLDHKRAEEALQESEVRYKALFDNMNSGVAVYKAEKKSAQQQEQLLAMFDGMDEVVYVADPETHELLYMNRAAKDIWGDRIGERCHNVLQDRDSPCPFCSNGEIFGKNLRKTYIWEFQNEINRHWYRCIDRAIRWPNEKMVRFELAIDITDRKQAEVSLSQQNEYLAALNETFLGLINRLELNDLLEAIVARAGTLAGTPNGFIYLYDPGKNELEVRVGLGIYRKDIGCRLKPNEGLSGKVWETGRPLMVKDYSSWSGRALDDRFNGIQSLIGIPLKSESGVAGVIGLGYYEEVKNFSEQEIGLLSRFAELASLALNNAQLYEEIQQELTQRKKAEKALRENEERYRALFYNNPIETITVGNEARVTGYNKAKEQSGGGLPNIGDIMYKDYASKHKIDMHNELMECIKSGVLKTFPEQKYKGKYLYIGMSPFPDGAIITSIDITGEKEAEKALRESEERLQAIFESNPNPMVVYDTEGHVQYVNPAFTELFGWSLDELKGRRIPFVPDDQKEITSAKLDEVYSGKNVQFETKRLTRQGDAIDVIVNGACIKGLAEKPVAMVSNLMDISERKKLEAQFQQAQRMEALGTLGGGIAHDFNNLLMGIQGRTSLMLMDTDSSDPHFEHLKGIEDYVKSAADLTKQLLGFARGGKYEVKPTDINEMIKTSSRMFGRTKKEIKIHRKYQKDIWTVETDQGQIEQVLMNLYVNAWQAMPGGGDLYLQTENVTLDEGYVKPFKIEPGRYVKISVMDTGVGIDETTRQRIFDPFFTTKEMGRGTGLGLASVYGIIKNHGGLINVYSEKGEGTAFNIYFPASEKEIIEEKELSKDVLKGSETVLLVDDEDMIIDVGEQLLEKMGYTVLIARSGKEATEIYEKNKDKIDMVILDMIMPDMSGGDTFDRLKEINQDIKVLLSSGYSINGQATEILERGCDGFIQKPFNMKQLSRKIREILNG